MNKPLNAALSLNLSVRFATRADLPDVLNKSGRSSQGFSPQSPGSSQPFHPVWLAEQIADAEWLHGRVGHARL